MKIKVRSQWKGGVPCHVSKAHCTHSPGATCLHAWPSWELQGRVGLSPFPRRPPEGQPRGGSGPAALEGKLGSPPARRWAGGRAHRDAGRRGEYRRRSRRPAAQPARGSECARRPAAGTAGPARAAAGDCAPPRRTRVPTPSAPAHPRRGPTRPLRPLPRRHAQTQFLEEDGDGREAEARRAGEDRPLHSGGHAGRRHLRQSEG